MTHVPAKSSAFMQGIIRNSFGGHKASIGSTNSERRSTVSSGQGRSGVRIAEPESPQIDVSVIELGGDPGRRPSRKSGARQSSVSFHTSVAGTRQSRPAPRVSAGSSAALDWKRLWQKLQKSQLDELRSRFLQVGRMNRMSFVTATNTVLGSSEHSTAITELFDRVDVSAQGFITWSSFLDFVIGSVSMVMKVEKPPVLDREPLIVNDAVPIATTQIKYIREIDRFISADGRQNTATVHNHRGVKFFTVTGHEAPVTDTAYIPRLHCIVTASLDRSIFLWDQQKGDLRKRIFTPHAVLRVAYSEVEDAIFTGSASGDVEIWDPDTGRRKHSFHAHSDAVTALCPLPFASLVVSSSLDGTISVWDAAIGKIHGTHAHASAILSIAYSALTGLLICGGRERRITAAPPIGGRPMYYLDGHKFSVTSVNAVAWAPQAISVDEAGVIKVWDLRNFVLLQSIDGACVLRSAVLDSKRETMHLLGVKSILNWECFHRAKLQTTAMHTAITCMAYCERANVFAIASGADVSIYDDVTGGLRATFAGLCETDVLDLAVDESGAVLLAAAGCSLLRYNMQTGRLIGARDFFTDCNMFSVFCHSPIGTHDQVVTVVSEHGEVTAILLADWATGGRPREWRCTSRNITCTTYCHATTCIAVCGDHGADVICVDRHGTPKRSIPAATNATGCALTSDVLATLQGEEIMLWDLPDSEYSPAPLKPVLRLVFAEEVPAYSLSFAHGLLVAVQNADDTAVMSVFDMDKLLIQQRAADAVDRRLALDCIQSQTDVSDVTVTCVRVCSGVQDALLIGDATGTVTLWAPRGEKLGQLMPDGDATWRFRLPEAVNQ